MLNSCLPEEILYCGSFNLFQNTLPKHGVRTHLVDPVDPESSRHSSPTASAQ